MSSFLMLIFGSRSLHKRLDRIERAIDTLQRGQKACELDHHEAFERIKKCEDRPLINNMWRA